MLNFRNTNILFVLMLAIIIALNYSFHVPVYVYVLLLIIYSLILFYGSYFISSGFYIKAICSAKTEKKIITLSFDDGPAQSFTPEILKILKDNNTEAAFFCIGNNIAGNEVLLKAISDQGHIIANHSYSHHFWFDLFSYKKMLSDMKLMDSVVNEITGLKLKLFRPPYGVTNPNVKKAIIKGNYITIGWSLRSMDTVIKDEKKLLKKITKNIKPGAIILFHDTSKTTVSILPEFIRYVKANGYEIMRLDKMLNLQPYE
jgi:peptidoglycan/xylan/chitin deacetylase (PgdA/CDA1 family)